jgi:outer membrane protein assembly factor BamE (lipoprotein component of BamABCDE complex)
MFCRAGLSSLVALSLALVGGTLSGCPVPIPRHYDASSRQNLHPEILASLQSGVTTREDVILMLGEPDGAAEDESWLAYGSIYSKGGVIFVVAAGGGAAGAGGETVEYCRLVVTFDAHGVLQAADFVSRECWESMFGMGSGGASTPPCMDIASPEDADTCPQGDDPGDVN